MTVPYLYPGKVKYMFCGLTPMVSQVDSNVLPPDVDVTVGPLLQAGVPFETPLFAGFPKIFYIQEKYKFCCLSPIVSDVDSKLLSRDVDGWAAFAGWGTV